MAVVIVTGAGRGIGACITRGLAARGHIVYAGMRSPEGAHELGDAPGDVRPLVLDVTEPASVRDAVARVVEESGRIEVLVNNAGVAWFSPAEEMSEYVLRTTMETNFFGAVRCTREVLPLMRRQGGGRIVMISSLAAATGLPLESAYCASKSALEAFAESLRHEVDRFGIGIAVVEPGVTEGGLSTSVPDPQAPGTSAYQPLIDHTFGFYDAAQDDVESPDLVVEAVSRFLDGANGGFRHRLGRLGPVIEQLAQAPDEEAVAGLREVLGIEWWSAGKLEAPGR